MYDVNRIPLGMDRLARGASLSLICVACVGKLYSMFHSESGDLSSLKWLIAAEAFFLIWVGLNRDILLKHMLLLAFFVASIVFQFARLALGYSACDCFGYFQPPASLILFVSSIALFCLVMTARRAYMLRDCGNAMRQLVFSFELCFPASVCLLLAVAYVASVAGVYSLPNSALAAIPDRAVFSGRSTRSVAFRNNGEVSIDIVGVTRTCKCAVVDGLPVTVSPGGIESVSLSVDAAQGTSGNGHIIFHTSSPLQPQVRVAYDYDF